MSVGLAEGLGPAVRVNTLMPGTFQTDVSKAWDFDAVAEDRQRATALRRVGQPPEIIGAALFLASDASSYTSGTVIRVDGGTF
jgi:NAD(P)-dependent dehydrogenase (short-subunit alcohol dehydrogenase family)